MSRWSPESLLVALYPSRVVAVRVERGWRTKVTDRRVVEAREEPAGGVQAADRGNAWRGTLAALDELLAGVDARAPATVVVASRFVRYAIVPWRDNVAGAGQARAFARHCLQSIYGDAAAAWEVRVSAGGFRRNSLASALDAGLLRGIASAFAARGVRVASIQPNFMAACNRYRAELGGCASAGIAVLEPGRVTLGMYDRKGWHYLSSRRLGTLGPGDLVPVLAQELRSADVGNLPEYLFVAAYGPAAASFFRTRLQAWLAPARSRIPEPVS